MPEPRVLMRKLGSPQLRNAGARVLMVDTMPKQGQPGWVGFLDPATGEVSILAEEEMLPGAPLEYGADVLWMHSRPRVLPGSLMDIVAVGELRGLIRRAGSHGVETVYEGPMSIDVVDFTAVESGLVWVDKEKRQLLRLGWGSDKPAAWATWGPSSHRRPWNSAASGYVPARLLGVRSGRLYWQTTEAWERGRIGWGSVVRVMSIDLATGVGRNDQAFTHTGVKPMATLLSANGLWLTVQQRRSYVIALASPENSPAATRAVFSSDRRARFSGAPSLIVDAGDTVYAVNGRIYSFAPAGGEPCLAVDARPVEMVATLKHLVWISVDRATNTYDVFVADRRRSGQPAGYSK